MNTKNKLGRVERVTGDMLISFMMINQLSQMDICRLFGISITKLNDILKNPLNGIQDPVTCYLYRQYEEDKSLIDNNRIDISEFYKSIGGIDAISGTEFSLTLGRELSAYVRWFNGNKPSASIDRLLQNAMKMNGKDAIAAFDAIKELCRREGVSRGIDVMEQRGWDESGKPKGVKRKKAELKNETQTSNPVEN